ncbi:aspartyl-phosphate phosphatase Spo0E family protein [Metabacillus mangrovi]|uniref:aspartyl-phosphate phosphatase Spo0E family protein n=1 Tax=Metabacillus mangrovi TaxID=1491830 RepID=UPI001F4F7674|nr:aspartyl-phosphate phosphatase Spo0E family protein [Metabacillus mangrovi]
MNGYETAVERSRRKMMDIAVEHGYTAEETVRASQHLDKLLNMVSHINNHGPYPAYRTPPSYKKKADSE